MSKRTDDIRLRHCKMCKTEFYVYTCKITTTTANLSVILLPKVTPPTENHEFVRYGTPQ